VLASYHTLVPDLSLLFLPILALLDFLVRRRETGHAAIRLIWTLSGALFCTPLYLFLWFRYDRLALMAVVILLLFMTICRLIEMTLHMPAVPAPPCHP
jgi:hypothetical protein